MIYKKFKIITNRGGHCALIYLNNNLVKCIAAEILPNGKTNRIEKAKKYIDNIKK